MEEFIIHPISKGQYPEVKRLLEGFGYELSGWEWKKGDDCVVTTEDGYYVTYIHGMLMDEDYPVHTVIEFILKYADKAEPNLRGILNTLDSKPTEVVNSPSHYNAQSKEVWEMMVDLYGKEKFLAFCELNAFKYRMRAGYKGDASQEIEKAKWYESKMKELGTA